MQHKVCRRKNTFKSCPSCNKVQGLEDATLEEKAVQGFPHTVVKKAPVDTKEYDGHYGETTTESKEPATCPEFKISFSVGQSLSEPAKPIEIFSGTQTMQNIDHTTSNKRNLNSLVL